jgi:radical SAM protein with 4Fe4S-binding SPASM domain
MKIVGSVVDRTSITEEDVKSNLQIGYWRKGLVSTLEGIAWRGPEKPFTSYAPFLVVWNFTNACNLSCKHCYQSSGNKPTPDELTAEEKMKAVDEMADAGVAYISLSGGEPLFMKDVFEVGKRIAEKGMGFAIATNGTMLTKETAQKLKDSGCCYVQISLDGTRKTHDEFRGFSGAFDKTVQGIRNSVNAGLLTEVSMTVTKDNLNEVEDIIDLTEELGASTFMHYNFIPSGRGKDIIDKDLSPEEREELLNFLAEECDKRDISVLSTAPQFSRIMASGEYASSSLTHFDSISQQEGMGNETRFLAEFVGGCGGGRLYCGLEPNGDIIPCVFLPKVLGNIKEDDFLEVWKDSEFMDDMRNRRRYDEGCGGCDYRSICGGCRARAYAYYGDVQVSDPGCIINKRKWESLKEEIGEKQFITLDNRQIKT